MIKIRPMNSKHGIGFTSNEALPEDMVEGYSYKKEGMHHNYHVTGQRYHWPVSYSTDEVERVIDAFSPNLNKDLHVGHLRNLAIANSLNKIRGVNTKFVALLGCSLGVKKAALDNWEKWTNFVDYHPDVYYDCALPQDMIETRVQDPEAMFPSVSPEIWDGPQGEVIVRRSDGRYLYAFHDLSFAAYVGPTHYITGHEQKEHFDSLGLGEKHFSMGLVLGDDGKKMKSRDGGAFLATEAMEQLQSNFKETPEPEKLAWNLLSWNCLQVKRDRDLKFEPEKWIEPNSPGMYITYTYARILSALGDAWDHNIKSWGGMVGDTTALWRPEDPDSFDVKLAGLAEQYPYYLNKSINDIDPSPLAQFAHTLALSLGKAYHKEKIKDGRDTFKKSVMWAAYRLRCCMDDLGMFIIEEV